MHEALFNADAESASLSRGVRSDVEAFVAAIERNELELAVSYYHADFFAGYGAPGAGRFEERGIQNV